MELATLQWVASLSNHRPLDPMSYIPPAEAEADCYRHLASQANAVVA